MASGISTSNRRASSTSLMRNASNRESLLWRATFIMLGVTTLMSICVLRLVQLQIIEGQYNQHLAEQNRIRPIPVPAERGNILDRNGKLLAANRLSRSVYLWPRQQSPEHWRVSAEKLGTILEMPAQEILDKLEQAGYNSPLPVRITQQLSQPAFVAIAEHASELQGVEIIAGSSRYYPQGSLAAHVMGYIGEATETDMEANPSYPSGMIVGQMGIERLANKRLEGVWGSRLIEVNAAGQEQRLLGMKPAIAGKQAKLTLDINLQQAAERALNGRRGAAVVLDVKTGEVLALASSPAFDPNIFTRRVTQVEWQRLQEGDQPFLNRVVQSYPPGSTFKIVTATAGMESDKFSPNSRIATSAYLSMGGIQFWEHSKHGYGVIGFPKALAVSSNTFFFRVGLAVGPEQLANWGKIMGIGTTKLGLEGETLGLIPTPAEKEELYDEPWYAGDTVSMSIGQGLVQVSPLEMAVVASAIANGGMRVKPHLMTDQTNTADMKPVPTGIHAETINTIKSGMVAVVREGTGRGLNDGSIPLTAGKTGTSEVLGRRSHALFVGFGPVSSPKIAVAVIVENGGYGGVAALPVAREIYRTYFKNHPQNAK